MIGGRATYAAKPRCAGDLPKSPSRQHRAHPRLSRRLVTLADPRHRRGRRHSFVSVLLVACSAVLAGARSFTAIGQLAKAAPQTTLARLGAASPRCSASASHGARRPCAAS
ncbi:transposase family protein [Streptomyces sp. NPDC088350]|uniref:transposase family protein n=1 Tax=Streptomyces sp. NPDC088350 TaxID=3365854 RepID=UPI00382B5805